VAANAKTMKETFKVGGNCETCKERIEKTAKGVKGVISANWNSKTKQLALVFDDKSTSVEKVQKAIAAVGHDAGNVKASKAAYDKLPGCCKYQKSSALKAKEKSYAQHGFGIRLFSFFDVRERLSSLKGNYFTTLKNCFAWARVLKLKCHHSVLKGLKPACCITKRKSSRFRCASLVMIRFATKLFSLSTCDASDIWSTFVPIVIVSPLSLQMLISTTFN